MLACGKTTFLPDMPPVMSVSYKTAENIPGSPTKRQGGYEGSGDAAGAEDGSLVQLHSSARNGP